MTDALEIRESTAADLGRIASIYPLAFPDEALLPLVRDLLADPDARTSLVGEIDGEVVGHVIFTNCGLSDQATSASLLGPLAVTPTRHGRGIGSALVRAGLEKLKDDGMGAVFVLGDPTYYGRFGFEPGSPVEAPYPLPEEWHSAWQSQVLSGLPVPCSGKLIVPAQWQEPALWSA